MSALSDYLNDYQLALLPFGWHFDDCALPLRHAGYCEHGGIGHVIPPEWKLRG